MGRNWSARCFVPGTSEGSAAIAESRQPPSGGLGLLTGHSYDDRTCVEEGSWRLLKTENIRNLCPGEVSTLFPEQDCLLAPSLREWLPENHLAYFVSDLIDQLDLSAIEIHYEREERGYPPYHPRMMTKVLIYGYCVGVFSSRRLEKRLVEDIGFRVLAANNEPDFRTIAEFRRILLPAQTNHVSMAAADRRSFTPPTCPRNRYLDALLGAENPLDFICSHRNASDEST